MLGGEGGGTLVILIMNIKNYRIGTISTIQY